jgi:hypothetical protein
MEQRSKEEKKDCTAQSMLKQNRGAKSEVPQDESQMSFGGLLALGYGRKKM